MSPWESRVLTRNVCPDCQAQVVRRYFGDGSFVEVCACMAKPTVEPKAYQAAQERVQRARPSHAAWERGA